MTKLAIKGHATRGQEVIQLLEMFGGKNTFHRLGNEYGLICYLDDKNSICQMQINDYNPCSNYTIFTLEEFEKKFPYKVGDKVTLDKSPCIITEMYWDCDDVIYYVNCDDFSKGVYSTDKDLQPYKEETMEENRDEPKAPILSNRYDYAEGKCGYVIPDGYEFDCIKEGFQTEIILKPKKYPKDYEACKALLHLQDSIVEGRCGYEWRLISNLQKLLLCRDAYWKIAGEEMGLNKPWKHEWTSGKPFYCISVNGNIITEGKWYTENKILAFPTEEMRDAFFENFKDLINDCKELL